MSGSVGNILASAGTALATGGLSTVAETGMSVAKGGVTPSALVAGSVPMGPAAAAATAGATALGDKTGGGLPAAGKGPTTPSLSDAAKQAQLDEAKRASMTGPSDITNTGGARGILTDPNAKYVTGKLLGGA